MDSQEDRESPFTKRMKLENILYSLFKLKEAIDSLDNIPETPLEREFQLKLRKEKKRKAKFDEELKSTLLKIQLIHQNPRPLQEDTNESRTQFAKYLGERLLHVYDMEKLERRLDHEILRANQRATESRIEEVDFINTRCKEDFDVIRTFFFSDYQKHDYMEVIQEWLTRNSLTVDHPAIFNKIHYHAVALDLYIIKIVKVLPVDHPIWPFFNAIRSKIQFPPGMTMQLPKAEDYKSKKKFKMIGTAITMMDELWALSYIYR